MGVKSSIVWTSEQGELELAHSISPKVLRDLKASALRAAQHRVAANVGDEVRELWAKLEYIRLKKLLDYVVPPVCTGGEERV